MLLNKPNQADSIYRGAPAMHIRKWLLSTVVCASFAGMAPFAQAAPAYQPNSNWAISKIAATALGGDSYCALARRFDKDLIFTIARNARDESSIALDFQSEKLNKGQSYNVTLKTNVGQARSFNVTPVSGKAIVIRLGKDYAFYDALDRSSSLEVALGSDSYVLNVPDFATGKEQLNGCLATFVEPAAGGDDMIPEPVTQVASSSPRTPTAAPAPAPAASQGEMEELRRENNRLRSALETERRNFENKFMQQDSNSSVTAELTEKIQLLEQENASLRGQSSSSAPAAMAAASCPAPDAANPAVSQEMASLREENTRLRKEIEALGVQLAEARKAPAADNAEIAQYKAQLEDANRKVAEAGQRVVDANKKLAEVTQQSMQTQQELASTAQKAQQAGADAAALTEANQKLATLGQQLTAEQQKATELTQQLQAVQGSQQALAEATQRATDLQKQVTDLSAQAQSNTNLTQALAEANQRVAGLQEQVTNLSGQAQGAAGLNQSLTEANQRIADLQQQVTTLSGQAQANTTMTQALAESSQKAQEADQKLADALARAAEAEKKLADESARAATAEQQLAQAAANNASIAQQATGNTQALTDATAKAAAAEQRALVAEQSLQDANSRLAEATAKLNEAPAQTANVDQLMAESNKRVTEAEQALATANARADSASQQVNELQQQLAAAKATPMTPEPEMDSLGIIPSDQNSAVVAQLQERINNLMAENDALKQSVSANQGAVADSLTPAPVNATQDAALVARLHVLEEQLLSVQGERDRLASQIDAFENGKDKNLMNIASSNWDLEQATRRFNEAEREARRLGTQIEKERSQCSVEKREIEAMLFDPQIAEKEQIGRMQDLETEAEKAKAEVVSLQKELADSRQHIAQLESRGGVSQAGLSAAPRSASPRAPGSFESAMASEQQGVRREPVSQSEARAQESVVLPQPVEQQQLAQTIHTEVSKATGTPAKVMSATDMQKFLGESRVSLNGAIRPVKATDGAASSYSWDAGNLFGSAEQHPANNGDFDAMAGAYLNKTKSRCQGDFAAVPVSSESTGSVKVSSYEIACVGQASSASASIVFFNADGVFTTIAHEGSIDDMEQAMDIRDNLVSTILQTKMASR